MAEIPPVAPALPVTSPKKVKSDETEDKRVKKRSKSSEDDGSDNKTRAPHIDERV